MNPKRPFGKLKGSAPQSSIISFRYTKHDEEVEGVIFEKNETPIEATVESNSSKLVSNYNDKDMVTSSEKKKCEVEDLDCESKNISDIESAPNVQETPKPKERRIIDIDSAKDNHAKLSARARSLDSETEPLENESWAFLKDLKGRIAKNIEECINKDVVKGVVADGDSVKPVPGNENKSLTELTVKQDVSSLPSSPLDARSSTDHISPSVEATESLEDSILSSYTNNTIEFIKSDKPEDSPSTLSRSQFGLPLKKKKPVPKPDFNMKLSALMASRSFSSEEDKSESSQTKPDASEKPAVINSGETTDSAVSPNPETSSEAGESEFSKIFLQMKCFCHAFTRMSWAAHVVCFIFLYLVYYMLPIPSSVFWFSIGTIMSGTFTYWFMKPAARKEPFKMPDYQNLPPLTIPALDIATGSTIYKGWMNELPYEYNPETYHVNCTHSVYIRLDGSSLRVSYPKSNIPKRAMFNESRHEPASLYPRHHDITGATVELLPKGLTRKRLWSKKYPICLKFTDQSISVNSKDQSAPQFRSSKTQSSKESSPSKKYEPKLNEDGEIVLYLFARTDREKDDWYRRFLKASRIKMIKSHSPLSSPNIASLENSLSESKRAVSVDLGSLQSSTSLSSISSFEERDISYNEDDDTFTELLFDKQLKFEYYMNQLLLNPCDLPGVKKRFQKDKNEPTNTKLSTDQDMQWLNALIGRMFFDFITEEVWADVIAERIQKKLSKIKLPNFIEELKITDKNLGTALPKIHRTSSPVVDQRGLWIDIDISYDGHFQMTLETKLNLLRLQKSDYPFSSYNKDREMEEVSRRSSHIYDSEEEDSAESSSDDDVPMPEMGLSTPDEDSSYTNTGSGGSTGKKLIRLVDKIAQSNYFQSAAKNKFIKRAMTEVSNMPLVLTIEISWLTGTLALNIPPMPTDRLWYGFRKNPELCIEARPKLGCHAVKVSHITEWIEQKLVLEFQKVLVMPNMDDLMIPIMRSDV